MTRLDRHVAMVRGKLTFAQFLQSLAWGSLGLGVVALGFVLVDKFFQVRPPRWEIWLAVGAGVTVVASWAHALWRRPTLHEAAVAIDEKLGLKEKFSTALYVRPSDDPFAQATVRDAEATAEKVVVEYRRHFPMKFPGAAWGTAGVALAAFLCAAFLPTFDLFGKEEQRKALMAEDAKKADAKRTVQRALATVNSVPKAAADDEVIKLAKRDLEALLNDPIKDPAAAQRKALQALQNTESALREQIKNNRSFAEAQNDAKMFRKMDGPPQNEAGPVADAHRAIAKGDFSEAVNEVRKAVEKFDQMSEEEKKKAADQMKNLAQELSKMASDPQKQEEVKKQLKQMGADDKQAKEMQKLMQQAAAGDKQAQQQLQQQAQQLQQQMNNGQGPTPQQQQAIQNMMNQMQAQANSQNQAQQMANAAQAMAQAMQQQGQQGQQNGQQQQQQQQQQAGQQQMADAQQQMQDQLQKMQATQQDAQQIAAAQQAAQQAADQACAECNGQSQGQQGQQGQQANNQAGNQGGDWKPGDPQGKPGQGFGGPGQAAGARPKGEQAPFGVKQEVSQSQDNQTGKIIASNYIKDPKGMKGESKETLKEVAAVAEREMTDEVDQERISRQAREVVKDYFGSMSEEAPK